ncbi:transporter [Billgrantia sulfidoxydans]|uniref:Transporter n=1 Tax=Billgrantia sulfidoxydans TaxID=2733484 RepID=A0ABX7W9I3_9GAMM|nr:transporter [Halomonas sulfidoxydans]QTP56591.1 transporter [Halomonas sulfidoxydans]
MQTRKTVWLAALGASLVATPVLAVNGHYPPGIEGLNAAAAPSEGLYYRGYLLHYDVEHFNDGTGTAVPGDNSGSVTALAHRFIWMTGKQFLGADYGMEAIVPMLDIEFELGIAGGQRFDDDGIGDVFVGPLILGWHGEQWDATFAAGHWFDSADFDVANPASVGKGYGTTMLTLGGVWHLDAEKRWNVSALSRYEIKTEQDDTGITPGDSWLVEWGIGHRLTSGLELGLVGYDAWQLEADDGATTGDKAERHAIGVEAGYLWPTAGVMLKGAAYHEYDAGAGGLKGLESEGDTFRLQLTKFL